MEKSPSLRNGGGGVIVTNTTYAAIENKLRNIPEEYLSEISEYLDFLIFRDNRDREPAADRNVRQFFGSVRSLGDGLEMQRQMRDAWN